MQLLANLKVKRPRGIEFIEHVIQDNFVAGACLLLMAKLFELLHANGGMQIGHDDYKAGAGCLEQGPARLMGAGRRIDDHVVKIVA